MDYDGRIQARVAGQGIRLHNQARNRECGDLRRNDSRTPVYGVPDAAPDTDAGEIEQDRAAVLASIASLGDKLQVDRCRATDGYDEAIRRLFQNRAAREYR